MLNQFNRCVIMLNRNNNLWQGFLLLILLTVCVSTKASSQTLKEMKDMIVEADRQIELCKKWYESSDDESYREKCRYTAARLDTAKYTMQVYVEMMETDTVTASGKAMRILAKKLLNLNMDKDAFPYIWAGMKKGDQFCSNYLGVIATNNGDYALAARFFGMALPENMNPYPPAMHNLAIIMLSKKYKKAWGMFGNRRESQGLSLVDSYLRYADPGYDPLNPEDVPYTKPALQYTRNEFIEAPSSADENNWREFLKGNRLRDLIK